DAPDWKLDISKLESHISSKTRAIIINTPTNPSGKVYSKDEIIQLGRIAKKHDIFLITDEIYEYFLYDDSEHISPGSISEFKDCVITISGYSKTFSITGWRIGYIVCNKDLAKDIGFVHDLMYVCAPAPLQIGVAEGIMKLDNSFYDNLKLTYKYKRDLICDALNNAGLNPIKPQGAYYVLADISRLEGVTSKEKTMNFLRMTKIAIVPGEAFYHDSAGDNIARVCFAKDDSILKSVADILLSVKV
ncbi:MAG: aminotransferase, partial [Ignavibacteriales bacterium CG12_big_fil_rev_8_21_14_0_65_30_8]